MPNVMNERLRRACCVHTHTHAMRYERRMDVRRSRLSTLDEPRKVHPKRPRIQLVRFVSTAPLYYNEKKIEGYMNAKKKAGKKIK